MDATFDAAVAFLSYAHADDDADEGRVRRLAAKIQNEYQFLTGQRLEVFIDRKDIRWGEQWKERVDGALQSTTFFIPVLSNSFFASDECRREFLEFYNTTTSLGVAQWLLAIRYGPVADLRTDSSDPIKAIAAATQFKAWETLRLVEENSSEHRTAVNDLAKRLQQLVELETTAPAVAEVPDANTPNAASPNPRDETSDDEGDESTGDSEMYKSPNDPSPPTGGVVPDAPQAGFKLQHGAATGTDMVDPDDPYGDAPSDIELVAEFEPRAAKWTELMGEFQGLMANFTEPISRGTVRIAEADAAGKPFAYRLQILRDTAKEIDEPSKQVEGFGRRYMGAVLTLDGSVKALIRLAEREDTSSDISRNSLLVAKEALNNLAAVGRNSAESVRWSVLKGRDLAKMSRDLRPAIRRYETGCQSIIDAQILIDVWATEMNAVPLDSSDDETKAE